VGVAGWGSLKKGLRGWMVFNVATACGYVFRLPLTRVWERAVRA